MNVKEYVFWFIAGSQHLYGEEALRQVRADASAIAEYLNGALPCTVRFKAVAASSEDVLQVLSEANTDAQCAGVITWMHTFSPSKMWIAGLSVLQKPLLHLNTQFNREIPWDTIDMDFMNLNQSAHGDREHGFIGARMRINRKVVAGYWQDAAVLAKIEVWMRACIGAYESRRLKVLRFGDNMREVAVTEGDKIQAQIRLGWQVNTYGVGALAERAAAVTDTEINRLMDEYASRYDIATTQLENVRAQARLEASMRSMLEEGGFGAYTNTFEDLYGLSQLPGLASQRLMEAGFGFGAEGDWKAAALTAIMKKMSAGLSGGTSFMEDYTYHYGDTDNLVLGAHMLEICPSIASARPRLEVHPLSIGGKEDPARLVFDGREGPVICACIIDMGGRFRLLISEADAVKAPRSMPRLPVARVMWKPRPSLSTSEEALIHAGGSHHTVLSYALTTEMMRDFAEIMNIECIVIDANTRIGDLKRELRYSDIVWKER